MVEVVGDLARFAGSHKTGGARGARPSPIAAGPCVGRAEAERCVE
jgi:hypothetical protein